MKRYYKPGDYWYDLHTGEIDGTGMVHVEMPKPIHQVPFISKDHQPYKSPVTGEVIDGRAHRREHMKRNNLREVDNTEFKPVYRNPEFCKKHNISPDRMGDPLPKSQHMGYDTPPQGLERMLRR